MGQWCHLAGVLSLLESSGGGGGWWKWWINKLQLSAAARKIASFICRRTFNLNPQLSVPISDAFPSDAVPLSTSALASVSGHGRVGEKRSVSNSSKSESQFAAGDLGGLCDGLRPTLRTPRASMDEPSIQMWLQLPFPDEEPPSEPQTETEDETSATRPAEQIMDQIGEEESSTTTAAQGPSRWVEHFTYRDYQLLPCTYVIRPADMLDAYSSLDSHSDYQGFLETMPLNYPPKKYQGPRLRLTENPEEEELVKMAKRVGLIQHLPTGSYDGCRKNRECVICMMEFSLGEGVRYLPCMHTYHIECINSWLMRSFVCPSCLEPVDAALLTSYETN